MIDLEEEPENQEENDHISLLVEEQLGKELIRKINFIFDFLQEISKKFLKESLKDLPAIPKESIHQLKSYIPKVYNTNHIKKSEYATRQDLAKKIKHSDSFITGLTKKNKIYPIKIKGRGKANCYKKTDVLNAWYQSLGMKKETKKKSQILPMESVGNKDFRNNIIENTRFIFDDVERKMNCKILRTGICDEIRQYLINKYNVDVGDFRPRTYESYAAGHNKYIAKKSKYHNELIQIIKSYIPDYRGI
jgi:hypothetical protein